MARPNTTKEAIERIFQERGLPGEVPQQTVARLINQYGGIEDAAPELKMRYFALYRYCAANEIVNEPVYIWKGELQSA